MLDLILVEGMSPLKILFVLPTAYFGGHVHFKGVHTYQCRKAALRIAAGQAGTGSASVPAPANGSATTKACVHTDGEITGFEESVSFALSQEHLQVIMP